MGEFIGVTHLPRISNSLKRAALIFNRIGIYDYKHDINVLRKEFDEHLLNDVEWLLEQGLLFELDDSVFDSPLANHPEMGSVFNAYVTNYIKERRLNLDNKLNAVRQANNQELSRKAELRAIREQYIDVRCEINDIFSRAIAIQLREISSLDTFPLSYSERLPITKEATSRADVIRVVVNALPVPDDNTSWEQIIEYRDDPNSFGKFLALRRWVTDVAKAQLSPIEIEDNLEWLLYDYQRHLNLHKLKADIGAFETVLTVGAEFLENLAKVNWGKAAKLLFTLRHRKVDLMEAEMKSPGSEVAYILEAWKQFGGRT